MKNIEKSELPENVKEGSILHCINGKYFINEQETKNTETIIKEKMDNLWD